MVTRSNDPSLAIHPARKARLQANSSDIQWTDRDSIASNPPSTSLAQDGNPKSSQNKMRSFLRRHDVVDECPRFRTIKTAIKRLREPDVLSPGEIASLVAVLDIRERAMVMLAGSTGLRR